MLKSLRAIAAVLGVISIGASALPVIPPPPSGGTITGQIQIASSGRTLNNGTITFSLTQPAVVSGSAVIAPVSVSCFTDNSGNVVGEPNPQQTPVLSQNLGSGTLPAGTYFVKIVFSDASGSTTAGPEATFSTGGVGTLIVSAPNSALPFPANATSYSVYISTSTGTETLQGSVSGTPGAWANYSQSAPLVSGSALPGANTTACSVRFNDELVPSFTGYNVTIKNSAGSTVPGYPQKWYLRGGSGGTINLSTGTPIFTGVVQFPQAIVANPAAGGLQSINGSLSITGSFLASATYLAGDGSVSTPSIAFSNEVGLGVYRAGATDIRVAGAAADMARFDPLGVTVPMGRSLCWGSSGVVSRDTGFSRTGPGAVSLGNCTQGDASGSLALSTITATSYNSVKPKVQVFTSNGTFMIPTGVTAVKVTVVGGGGGGGGGNAGGPAGGGGSGGIAIKYLSGLTSGNTIAVTVGASAAGGLAGANGTPGNASSIASGTQTITTVTANGGLGGSQGGAGGGASGAGAAVSTNGDINGAGAPGSNSTSNFSGAGGSTFLGGAGSISGGGNGVAAIANTGSGGSGAFTGGAATGGAGGSGIVIFEWVN